MGLELELARLIPKPAPADRVAFDSDDAEFSIEWPAECRTLIPEPHGDESWQSPAEVLCCGVAWRLTGSDCEVVPQTTVGGVSATAPLPQSIRPFRATIATIWASTTVPWT